MGCPMGCQEAIYPHGDESHEENQDSTVRGAQTAADRASSVDLATTDGTTPMHDQLRRPKSRQLFDHGSSRPCYNPDHHHSCLHRAPPTDLACLLPDCLRGRMVRVVRSRPLSKYPDSRGRCMRVAIIADIHANLTAFRAVVADFAVAGGIDEVWNLGDTVGYGPDPNDCIELLTQFRQTSVAGNHDHAAIGRISTDEFNPAAAEAAAWTASALGPNAREFILGLPSRAVKDETGQPIDPVLAAIADDTEDTDGPATELADPVSASRRLASSALLDRLVRGYTLVHGSPRHPIWEYVVRAWQAAECFPSFSTRICFVGHSHVPLVFAESATGARYVAPDYAEPLAFASQVAVVDRGLPRRIINPGSVGQPRGGNPRASYIVLDTDAGRLSFREVAYDVGAVQARMRELGLPRVLWERLAHGI